MAKFLISAVMMVCLAAVAISGGLAAGGWRTTDPNSELVQGMAKLAVSTANRRSDSLYHKKLVQVIEAQTQIVSGTNYRLKIEIHPTVCSKRDVHFEDVENCDIDENAASEICDVTIYDQSWTSTRSITNFQCHRQE